MGGGTRIPLSPVTLLKLCPLAACDQFNSVICQKEIFKTKTCHNFLYLAPLVLLGLPGTFLGELSVT